ncbi:MAG: hypothetical protein F9K15_12425 [Zoogloea sp.]|nr:MAG: hypothetical protein F9K15_12425 [Zoogloea sp.]
MSFLLLPDVTQRAWVWPVLAASMGWHVYRRKTGVRRLELLEDGGVCLEPGAPDQRTGLLAPSSVALEHVFWLAWQGEEGRGAMMLCADQFLPEDWRQLQRWARLRGPARSGAEPAPGGEGVSSVRDRA